MAVRVYRQLITIRHLTTVFQEVTGATTCGQARGAARALSCFAFARSPWRVSATLSDKGTNFHSQSLSEADMEVAPGKTKVGWIGTGVMGLAMCEHILAAGYQVTAFSRTLSKAQPLEAKGATLVSSPKEVAAAADIVFSMVGYPSDVRSVILGPEGVLAGLRPGGVTVDMTTSDPSLAREIAGAASESGRFAVDAPVSGGDKGARTATLSIMTGGDKGVVESLQPLFACMGKVTYLGPAGSGQSCKLGNQITICSTMVGLVEGMLYAHRAGLDVPTYLQAISGGAAGSKSIELYAQRLMQRDFAPGFYVNHFVKDLGIALEESRKMGLSLPGLALAQQLYVSLQAHGDGNLGTQALLLALERLNNTTLPTSSR